jgi:hypothetical protein
MKNSTVYLLGLLVLLIIASLMAVAAQGDNKIILNNINSNNSSLNNMSLNNLSLNNIPLNNTSLKDTSINLLINNSTCFDANNLMMVGSEDSSTFIISSNVTIVPTNVPKINITSQSSEIQPPKRTTFVIDYVWPGSSTSYENRSLLNGAYLSRKVEGTPHGYVTYYN